MSKKEIGHNFLAKLGKKRLRPGGVEATNWLIEQANLDKNKLVLEVACNMCTTSIEIAQKYRCQIIGIDLDKKSLEKAKANINKARVNEYIHIQQGNAMKLPFADNTFDIVINEAMLTMLDNKAKEQAIKEYFRVLKSEGKLLTHDVSYDDKSVSDVINKLRQAININVTPLYIDAWKTLFEHCGFSTVTYKFGEMSLMSFRGMIKDEGIINTLKIIKNSKKAENKEMFNKMHTFFTKTGKDLKYIAICSKK